MGERVRGTVTKYRAILPHYCSHDMNTSSVATRSTRRSLYAGLDWDLEGNDNLSSPNNFFTAACINLMGDLSTLLHDAGYIVSMAPPESYFDVQTSEFSKYVNLTYPSDVWPNVDPQFQYHGRNSYAAAYALNPDGETVCSRPSIRRRRL